LAGLLLAGNQSTMSVRHISMEKGSSIVKMGTITYRNGLPRAG